MENDGHTRLSTGCYTLAIVPAPALTHMITHTHTLTHTPHIKKYDIAIRAFQVSCY